MPVRKYSVLLIIVAILQMAFAFPAHANKPGTVRYNSETKKMEFFDGNTWYNFSAILAVGSCSKEGEMHFDPLLGLLGSYRYCGGAFWRQITGITTLSSCDKKAAMDFNGSTYLVCNGLFWVNVKGAIAAS